MAAEMQKKREIAFLISEVFLREVILTSSSESGEEEKLLPLMNYKPRVQRRKRVRRSEDYAEVIVPSFTDGQFKSHFRMERQTFEYVLRIIAPSLMRKNAGRPTIEADKQFLIALWRMATPDSYQSICEKFNISKSTALFAVRRVTHTLVKLAPAVIRWPLVDQAPSNWAGFEATSAFPKVIGAIDGKHVNIPAPKIHAEAYVNRKGQHAIHLQGVCDHKGRFIHVYVGHVGSVHDQRVFRQSDVQSYLGDEMRFPDNCHLVGDPAYKLHENLLVPYRDNGHLTDQQKNFNFCLSSARMSIERAFGLLTARFRSVLTMLPMRKVEETPDFVLACCALHNMCSFHHDELEFTLLEVRNQAVHVTEGAPAAALAKRDYICETLRMRNV